VSYDFIGGLKGVSCYIWGFNYVSF